MSYRIERDWTTAAGLRAVCLWSAGCGHRCGYVEVPLDHPLHGVHYAEHSPHLVPAWEDAKKGDIGKRGIIDFLCATEHKANPSIVFDVHGSITYSAGGSKGYPIATEGWWFGFDCGHAGDRSECCDDGGIMSGGVMRSEQYVVDECESLAAQLAAITPTTEKEELCPAQN